MVSIVIPAYNEEASIAATVATARAVMVQAGESQFEIVVVDDGSADRTAEFAESEGATVIRKLQNMGYGNSLKLGIRSARYDTIVISDADGTYPLDRIPCLLAKYREGYDMVVGARTGEHYRESVIKAPLRAILKWLVEFTVGRRIPDINSGLRVFSREEAIRFFDHLCEGFSFTTSITLGYMLKMKFVEYLPIEYHKRIGVTKVRLFRDAIRTLQFIVQAILYYNPMKIFMVLALVPTVLGISMLAASLVWGGQPLALAGVGALLTSVLVFGMGLVSELLRQIWVKD